MQGKADEEEAEEERKNEDDPKENRSSLACTVDGGK